MSADIPAFHAGTMMVSARKQLLKMGWKQMDNGRLDCIEKTFGDVIVGTIWAGDKLLLNPRKKEFKDTDDIEAYVPLDATEVKQAIEELQAVFDRIVRRNKKQWDKEIKEYEERHKLKFQRNKRYGV